MVATSSRPAAVGTHLTISVGVRVSHRGISEIKCEELPRNTTGPCVREVEIHNKSNGAFIYLVSHGTGFGGGRVSPLSGGQGYGEPTDYAVAAAATAKNGNSRRGFARSAVFNLCRAAEINKMYCAGDDDDDDPVSGGNSIFPTSGQ